jgi:hypothetical protein
MNINVNVKRKFKVNGKEYNSIEEMPHDIREAFEKAIESKGGSGFQINPAMMQTKITFNSKEYNSIDEMPQNVRQLYEEVLKEAAETGDVPPDMVTADDINDMLTGSKNRGTTSVKDMGMPVKTEPTFSIRTLIISVLGIALIILLYYMFQDR